MSQRRTTVRAAYLGSKPETKRCHYCSDPSSVLIETTDGEGGRTHYCAPCFRAFAAVPADIQHNLAKVVDEIAADWLYYARTL